MREREITQEKLAERLGVSRVFVGYLLNGARGPGVGVAVELERLTNGAVRPEDWADARARRKAAGA